MKETIDRLRSEGAERIKATESVADVETIRVALLGRKGEVTLLLRALKDVAAEDRPAMAARLGKLIEQTQPEFFAEPALRFPLAAAHRKQGFPRQAER